MREVVVIVMIIVDNPLAIFSWKLREEGSQNIFCGYFLWGISWSRQHFPHKQVWTRGATGVTEASDTT